MSVELKPCPFCGRRPSVFPVNPKVEGDAWTKIECLTRGCVNPAARVYEDRGHYAKAAKRWNRRAERSAGGVDAVIADVQAEIDRAVRKFPTWPTDPLHACGVVQEESGELAKAVLQAVYEPHKATVSDVRAEAVQTAAMAIRFIRSLDAGAYEWTPGPQHKQAALGGA